MPCRHNTTISISHLHLTPNKQIHGNEFYLKGRRHVTGEGKSGTRRRWNGRGKKKRIIVCRWKMILILTTDGQRGIILQQLLIRTNHLANSEEWAANHRFKPIISFAVILVFCCFSF
ncbi:hypothetical protein BLNAU_14172 [Blattamonas nauphoetae]|uniref:Uncharacterized protein n=1 Tax=Blattamonas nauphoetae TaxID=2049346 RepID=A0ABQ9XHG0_9EUKA|nr:hypothetical protein BLNAU_14172 [Blattamonas nauphoetae]